jgi:tetratricopeptide (TPR) repeat protein
MLNRPDKDRLLRLKPLRLLGFATILLCFAWFAWKHLSVTVSVPNAPVSSTVERVYLGPRNSLAVLAFSSGDDGATPEYLGRGVVRELVDVLAAEPTLQLTAATSSLFPEAGMTDLEVAAQRLQVAHLVSGTIVLSGDRIRLQAALWDTHRKEVTWEGSREHSLQEVDALLYGVAADLLSQLPLNGRSPAAVYSRVPAEAWLDFVQGRDLAAMGSHDAARTYVERAVGLDPRFSAAQLELARLALTASPPGRDAAMAAIRDVLSRNPNLPRALGLRSYIERNLDWNWAGAADSAAAAVRLLPGDAGLLNLAGQALFSVGRHREAVEHFSGAVVRDPLNLNIRLGLGLAQEYLGQYDEALKTYRILLGLKPDFPGVHALRARIKLQQDNPDSALRESDQENDPFWKSYSRILALAGQGKQEEAASQWGEMVAGYGDVAAFQFAEIAACLGRIDAAFSWLHTARAQKDGGMRELLGNRFLAGLHSDPRWPELLISMELPLDGEGRND